MMTATDGHFHQSAVFLLPHHSQEYQKLMLAEALAVSSVLQLAELANHLSLLHPCLQGDQQLQLFQISYQIFTNKKKQSWTTNHNAASSCRSSWTSSCHCTSSSRRWCSTSKTWWCSSSKTRRRSSSKTRWCPTPKTRWRSSSKTWWRRSSKTRWCSSSSLLNLFVAISTI